MSFTTEQVDYAGRAAINWYLRNDPIDQISIAHPLLKKLAGSKKNYAGGLQYVVEQLRYSLDSNFQSYFGDSQVTYNRKRTLQQAKYVWGSFHDGFGLNEDELAQNGITVTDDTSGTPSANEKVALTSLLEENIETLNLGFQENFDIMIHRDGTQSTTDIPGLDLLISTTPSASAVIGGLNQSTYSWWRNYANVAIDDETSGEVVNQMEIAWRECTRYGGSTPDFILVGGSFLDAYRKDAGLTVNRQINGEPSLKKGGVTVDAGTTGTYFHGVELVWDPTFDNLQTLTSASVDWRKRCYFINSKYMSLRPISGHWMVNRKPPRVYDRYVHYWALTSKAAVTTGKRNAHAVLAVD